MRRSLVLGLILCLVSVPLSGLHAQSSDAITSLDGSLILTDTDWQTVIPAEQRIMLFDGAVLAVVSVMDVLPYRARNVEERSDPALVATVDYNQYGGQGAAPAQQTIGANVVWTWENQFESRYVVRAFWRDLSGTLMMVHVQAPTREDVDTQQIVNLIENVRFQRELFNVTTLPAITTEALSQLSLFDVWMVNPLSGDPNLAIEQQGGVVGVTVEGGVQLVELNGLYSTRSLLTRTAATPQGLVSTDDGWYAFDGSKLLIWEAGYREFDLNQPIASISVDHARARLIVAFSDGNIASFSLPNLLFDTSVIVEVGIVDIASVGNFIAIWGADDTVRYYDPTNLIFSLPVDLPDIMDMAVGDDVVVTLQADGTLQQIFAIDDPVSIGNVPNATAIALSPDAQVLAVGDHEGSIQFVDVATGDMLYTLEGSGYAIRYMTWLEQALMVHNDLGLLSVYGVAD